MATFGRRGVGMMILFALIGSIAGALLGELMKQFTIFSGVVPYLVDARSIIEMSPTTLSVSILSLTFGISLVPNVMSVLGIIAGIMLYRRY